MFMLFYSIYTQQYQQAMVAENQAEWSLLADKLADEINTAAFAGDGFERRIIYPSTLPGVINYTVLVNNVSGSIDVSVVPSQGETYTYSAYLLTRNVSGESAFATSRGFWIDASRGYAYLANANGTVVVTQLRENR